MLTRMVLASRERGEAVLLLDHRAVMMRTRFNAAAPVAPQTIIRSTVSRQCGAPAQVSAVAMSNRSPDAKTTAALTGSPPGGRSG